MEREKEKGTKIQMRRGEQKGRMEESGWGEEEKMKINNNPK